MFLFDVFHLFSIFISSTYIYVRRGRGGMCVWVSLFVFLPLLICPHEFEAASVACPFPCVDSMKTFCWMPLAIWNGSICEQSPCLRQSTKQRKHQSYDKWTQKQYNGARSLEPASTFLKLTSTITRCVSHSPAPCTERMLYSNTSNRL